MHHLIAKLPEMAGCQSPGLTTQKAASLATTLPALQCVKLLISESKFNSNNHASQLPKIKNKNMKVNHFYLLLLIDHLNKR